MLTFEFTGVEGRMTESETLTSGMVGMQVRFSFSEEWTDLQKTAVFAAGDVCRIVENAAEYCVIPEDVLLRPVGKLYVGVYGVSGDGQTVIPTVMAEGPRIRPGADPGNDAAGVEVMPAWKAVQKQIGQLEALRTVNAGSLVDAVNEVYRIVKSLDAMGTQGGKTAYTYAVEGGYTGTEAEFMEKLARPYAPVAKTEDMTQPVGVDGSGGLYLSPGEMAQHIYPVGSIYLSVSDTSPASLFGGSWERLKDRFLLAAGDTYEAGATGGEAAHTLTSGEMPKHIHNIIKAGETSTSTIEYPAYAIQLNSGSYTQSSSPIAGGVNSGGTSFSGASAAHNNMPPYLAVYMWKRVA